MLSRTRLRLDPAPPLDEPVPAGLVPVSGLSEAGVLRSGLEHHVGVGVAVRQVALAWYY